MTATPKNSLLILVPALNEEGAVGGVVRAIRESVPGTRRSVPRGVRRER